MNGPIVSTNDRPWQRYGSSEFQKISFFFACFQHGAACSEHISVANQTKCTTRTLLKCSSRFASVSKTLFSAMQFKYRLSRKAPNFRGGAKGPLSLASELAWSRGTMQSTLFYKFSFNAKCVVWARCTVCSSRGCTVHKLLPPSR